MTLFIWLSVRGSTFGRNSLRTTTSFKNTSPNRNEFKSYRFNSYFTSIIRSNHLVRYITKLFWCRRYQRSIVRETLQWLCWKIMWLRGEISLLCLQRCGFIFSRCIRGKRLNGFQLLWTGMEFCTGRLSSSILKFVLWREARIWKRRDLCRWKHTLLF